MCLWGGGGGGARARVKARACTPEQYPLRHTINTHSIKTPYDIPSNIPDQHTLEYTTYYSISPHPLTHSDIPPILAILDQPTH